MNRRGVTILEMIVVMTIISLMAGLMYPSISSGLDGLKLNTASDEVAAFLNGAMERANRRNTPVEIMFLPSENAILLHSTEAGFERRLDLPQGVTLEQVLPVSFAPVRIVMLYPGGIVPRIGVQIATSMGRRRIIRIDPITGTPVMERLPSEN
jgi:prepilin-type N-terminal cleavage/methylation domain-containing protein